MADFFRIGTSAVYIGADIDRPRTVNNAGASTVYYKATSDVGSGDTSVVAGASVTLTAGQWFISAASSAVTVTDLGIPVTASDVTAQDDITVTDLLTLGTGGVAPASTPTGISTWQPVAATSGTDTAFASGTVFVGSIYVPANKTLTGVAFLLGSVGGTDKVVVQLNSATGTLLANSTLTAGGTTAGTAANTQAIDFTSTYAAVGPARYWIGVSANGGTAKLRTVPAFTQAGVLGNSLTQTVSVPATIVPPTTFVADKVPIAWAY